MHCAFFSLECNSSSCPLCEGADPTINIAVTVLIVDVVLLTVILVDGVIVYSQRRKANHSRKHKERK